MKTGFAIWFIFIQIQSIYCGWRSTKNLVGIFEADDNGKLSWKCDGSLISPNIVVSAENCVGTQFVGYQLIFDEGNTDIQGRYLDADYSTPNITAFYTEKPFKFNVSTIKCPDMDLNYPDFFKRGIIMNCLFNISHENHDDADQTLSYNTGKIFFENDELNRR